MKPLQILSQFCKRGLVIADKINVLARRDAERRIGVRVQADEENRLFEFERGSPFGLADGFVGNAVARHDENQTVAFADRLTNLRVPIACRRVQFAPKQPNGK